MKAAQLLSVLLLTDLRIHGNGEMGRRTKLATGKWRYGRLTMRDVGGEKDGDWIWVEWTVICDWRFTCVSIGILPMAGSAESQKLPKFRFCETKTLV